MTYDTLDTIPYKLFLKILETENFKLLSDTEKDEYKLEKIWEAMYKQHEELRGEDVPNDIVSIKSQIEVAYSKRNLVITLCEVLEFDVHEESISLISNMGYSVSKESTEKYYADLERIKKQSKGYLLKVEELKTFLPKEKEENSKQNTKYTIDDVMASFSTILGYNIGKHNEITYSEFYGFDKSVTNKLKSLEKDGK